MMRPDTLESALTRAVRRLCDSRSPYVPACLRLLLAFLCRLCYVAHANICS